MLLSSLIGGAGGGGGSYPFATISGVADGATIDFVADTSGNNDVSWIAMENNKIKLLRGGRYYIDGLIEPYLIDTVSGAGTFAFQIKKEPYGLFIINYNEAQTTAVEGNSKSFNSLFTTSANSLLSVNQTATGAIFQKPIKFQIYKLLETESITASYGSKVMTSSGNFTVPSDVKSISVLMVSSGGTWYAPGNGTFTGGSPGRVVYSNNIPVTPGEIFNVVVGSTTTVTKGTLYLSTSTGSNYPSVRPAKSPHVTTTDSAGRIWPGGRGGVKCGIGPRDSLITSFVNNGSWVSRLGGGGGTSLFSNVVGGSGGGTSRSSGESAGTAYGGGAYGGAGINGGSGGPGAVRFIWGPDTSFPNNAPNTLPTF